MNLKCIASAGAMLGWIRKCESRNYIAAIEKRQGIKIGCPEEAALVRGFVKAKDLMKDIQKMPECDYKNYIKRVAEDFEKENFNVGFYSL